MNTSEVTLTKTASRPAQKVVVVNGTPDVLDLLESVLEGGRYDLLFADASQHAYSLIAKEQPNLVVLCTTIDRTDGSRRLLEGRCVSVCQFVGANLSARPARTGCSIH